MGKVRSLDLYTLSVYIIEPVTLAVTVVKRRRDKETQPERPESGGAEVWLELVLE